MATFTLTITVPQVQSLGRDSVAIAEVLRYTANVVERQAQPSASYTLADPWTPSVTRSSWTYS